MADPRLAHSAEVLPTQPVESVPYIDFRTLAAMMAHVGEVFCGTVEGTGALLEVACPFDPAVVIVWNEDDPTLGVHLPSMAAAHMLKLTDAPALTHAAVDGITRGAFGEKKFSIGADADLNVAAETLHFVAIGSRGLGGSA